MRSKKANIILVLILIFVKTQVLSQTADYTRKVDSLNLLIEQKIEADSIPAVLTLIHEVATVHEYEGNWDEYNKSVDQLLEIAEKRGDKGMIVEYYNKLGISSSLCGKNSQSIDYFKKGLELSIQINDSDRIANMYENMGLVYRDMGKYQIALECQMKTLPHRERIFHERLPNTYSNISQIFELMNEPEKQYEYLQKAIAANKKLPLDHARSAILCCEMGEYLMDRHKFDSSMVYFEEGLELCKTIGWQRGIAVFIGDMGELYEVWGKNEKAISYRKRSLQLSLDIEDCKGACQEYNVLTRLYLKINQPDSAIMMNDLALKRTIECENVMEYVDALEYESKIYEYLGQFDKSLQAFKRFHAANDSMIHIEKQEKMLELDKKYQTEQKEQQIRLLSAENDLKKQRIIIFVSIIVILVLIIGFVFYFYTKRKKEYLQKQERLSQRLLRSQMNPHFLFNALGSIQSFMYKNEPKKAARYLGNFAALTRSILEHSTKDYVSLADEIALLDNYLQLEQMRMKFAFTFSINIDEETDTEIICIPPMMLQPFVENAIKHGVKQDGGVVIIDFHESEDKVVATITDNGVGIKSTTVSTKSEHNSLSMKIFDERSKLLAKKLKRPVDYSITDLGLENNEQTGTRIRIELPIIEI